MKLRNWLLIAFLIVMVLPLIAAYVLFAWIQAYNEDQQVGEFIETYTEIQDIRKVASDPEWYQLDANRDALQSLAQDDRMIVLYNADGLVIYTSNPAYYIGLDRRQLYEGLYELNEGYRSYTYKEPVFANNELIGFFYVELARTEWLAHVEQRSQWTFIAFIFIFIIIYGIVILFVHRKLAKRLNTLRQDMTAFAQGKHVQERPTTNDEIGQLQQHFYKMKDQILEAQQVIAAEQSKKEYMIASVSHDLKTPLTSIKAYAESLENEALTDAERREYQQVIVEKADFMKQMLDDLLTYTLLQSPSYEMEFVEVDGSEFFDMLVSGYEPLCQRKNIKLQVDLNVSGTYDMHPQQMVRVADNLMMNAIQHTPAFRHIWLAAHTMPQNIDWLFPFVDQQIFQDAEDHAYLIVQNEGKGISNDKIDLVFDPLYQDDPSRSKRDDHGTGLGLSIAKQIVEKHAGMIHIFAKENIGTTVICKLPMKSGEKDENV